MRPRLPVLLSIAILTAVATPHLQTPSAPSISGSDTAVEEHLSAGAIIDRAIERAQLQDETGVELEFESLILTTVDSFNGDGEVTKTETTLHKRYALEGVLYEELVERDGQPLTDEEIRDEHEEREKFAKEVRKRARRGEEIETNDERDVRFDRDLFDRFQASVTGVEDIRGESAWVLSFEPRPGKLPEHTRMDKALNRSSGRLYIAQRDYGIMRIEFEMQEPMRYLWGLIATLKSAVGRIEFARVESDVWLPHTFDFEIDLRIFFRHRRQQIVREWVDRQHVMPAAGDLPDVSQSRADLALSDHRATRRTAV